MNVSTRRKLGVFLIAFAVLAMATFLVFGIIHGKWHQYGSGASDNVVWMAESIELRVSDYYLIPIIFCGTVGAFCLAWPSRKPPKLRP